MYPVYLQFCSKKIHNIEHNKLVYSETHRQSVYESQQSTK